MGTEGRELAFRGFFESEAAGLQRFATFMCGDPDQAADITQEALTRAYKRWWWLRRTEAPAYVRRIIVNLVRDEQRRKRLERKRLETRTREASQPSGSDRVGEWLVVTEALRALSPIRRATVVLRFYEDMTEDQIAHVLGRPLGTVKSDLHRALRELRVLFENELVEERK